MTIVERVGIGTHRDEEICHRHMVEGRGQEQSRAITLVAGLDVGTGS